MRRMAGEHPLQRTRHRLRDALAPCWLFAPVHRVQREQRIGGFLECGRAPGAPAAVVALRLQQRRQRALVAPLGLALRQRSDRMRGGI